MSRDLIIQAIVSGTPDGPHLCPRSGRPEPNFWAHGDRELRARRVSHAGHVHDLLVLGARRDSTRCCRCRWWPPCWHLPACWCTSASSGRLLKAPMLAQVCGTFGLAVALRAGGAVPLDPRLPHHHQSVDRRPRADRSRSSSASRSSWPGSSACCRFVALWLFVTRTETGLGLQATAQDRQAAAVMGIPTERMFGARLGDRAGLRRRGRHPALDLLLYLPRRRRELRPAGVRRRGARRLRQHPRQPRRRPADRARRSPSAASCSTLPTRR